MRKTEEKNASNFWQQLTIGGAAGALEALINHPLYVLKMRGQAANKSFKLYTGLFPNMSTMVLLTGIRLSLSAAANAKLNQETKLTQEHKTIISSFIGGGISSLVGSPMELLRYRQLHNNNKFHQTMKNLYIEGGGKILTTGLLGTGLRDSIYTFGFFSFAPAIKKYLQNDEKDLLHITILSGAIAGIIAGITSQPFDMAKTYQQTHLQKKMSLKASFANIYSQQGWKGYFNGSFFRIARVASGITIISTFQHQCNSYLSPGKNLGG